MEALSLNILSNEIEVAWLDDGPKMRLLHTYFYIDRDGKHWEAPQGHAINGADIPRFIQLIFGTPYGGKYRKASVMHDVYCDTRTEPYQDVHDMFLELLLDTGVHKKKAERMHWAASVGGPKWNELGQDIARSPEEQAYVDSVDEVW